jgi:lysine-N-methylase
MKDPMKKTVSASMLMPAYVKLFSCIGGECEDACCAGWMVTLDRESFRNYQHCIDPLLRPVLQK